MIDTGACQVLAVQRQASGPADGWQRRTFQAHVLTLFASGGIVEHALEGRAPRRIVIPSGGVVSSLRGVAEEVRLVQDSELFSVQLSDAVLRDAALAVGKDGNAALAPSPGISDPRLTGLMMALRAEQQAGWPTGPLFAESMAQALACLLLANGAVLTALRHALPARVAARIAAFIDAELARPLSLTELAAHTGYSVAQFTRLFRASFGTSPLRYVMARRVDRARQLLRMGRATQIEIALACGFQSQQHFARVFRAQVGMTPQAYRGRI
jgi:AraC family transcriptional regulator